MIVMARGICRPPLKINDDRCKPYTFSPLHVQPLRSEHLVASGGPPWSKSSAWIVPGMDWTRRCGGPRIAGGDFNSWWGEWWIRQMETEWTDTWQDVTGSDDNGYAQRRRPLRLPVSRGGRKLAVDADRLLEPVDEPVGPPSRRDPTPCGKTVRGLACNQARLWCQRVLRSLMAPTDSSGLDSSISRPFLQGCRSALRLFILNGLAKHIEPRCCHAQ